MVKQKQLLKHALIIVVSVALVLLTLLIPRAVKSQTESQTVTMGYPMHFITRDFSNYNPPMPAHYSMMSGSFGDNAMSVSYANFIVSILLVVLIVEVLEFFSERFFYTPRKKR